MTADVLPAPCVACAVVPARLGDDRCEACADTQPVFPHCRVCSTVLTGQDRNPGGLLCCPSCKTIHCLC